MSCLVLTPLPSTTEFAQPSCRPGSNCSCVNATSYLRHTFPFLLAKRTAPLLALSSLTLRAFPLLGCTLMQTIAKRRLPEVASYSSSCLPKLLSFVSSTHGPQPALITAFNNSILLFLRYLLQHQTLKSFVSFFSKFSAIYFDTFTIAPPSSSDFCTILSIPALAYQYSRSSF